MDDILQTLDAEVRTFFKEDSSGHDIYHLQRVLRLALHIQEHEGGDRLIIGVAAFLHDVHRIMQNQTGQFCSPKDSLPEVQKILNTVPLTDDQMKHILHCIEHHEEYNFSEHGKTVNDIETLILQDSDNLDAIGAIGIGRTFTYGGAKGVTMWQPEIPLERLVYNESLPADPSTLHHFYSKLLKLKNNFNTQTAKAMALKRHEFMEQFVKQFKAEWNGEC